MRLPNLGSVYSYKTNDSDGWFPCIVHRNSKTILMYLVKLYSIVVVIVMVPDPQHLGIELICFCGAEGILFPYTSVHGSVKFMSLLIFAIWTRTTCIMNFFLLKLNHVLYFHFIPLTFSST